MIAATFVLFWVAVIAAVAFPILYTVLAPWWRSQTGRHVFSLAAVIAVVLLIQVLRLVLGRHFPGRPVVDLLQYIGIAAVLLGQLRLLITSQIRRRRDAAGANHPRTGER